MISQSLFDENVLWSDLCNGVNALNAANLEDVSFVTTFRGKNIASDKKSLTLRLRFRDAKRTLTHDEANESVTAVIEILTNTFGAEIRFVMELGSQSINEFLDALAAKQPTPGGGAVAGVLVALSTSLGNMVLGYSLGKENAQGACYAP